MKAADIQKHEIIPTPIPLLNEILGGGFPSRILVEVAGMPGSGKSTLALQFIAQAQRLGHPCYYADTERAIDFESFATALGVDCAALEYDKQDYAEALTNNIINWIDGEYEGKKCISKPHENAVVVLDSVGGFHGREEAEKDMEAETRSLQARLMGKFCRKIEPIIDKRNTVFIFVNHLYRDQSESRFPLYKSKGGAVFEYLKGLSLWLSSSSTPPKKETNGTRTIEYKNAEIKSKAKYMGAFVGTKVELAFIPKQGFVGEFVAAPEKKKPGRPKKLEAQAASAQ